jgi:predicted nucleic acid-binding protein
LGWAKTYDAEYVALARLLGCRLVTLDARLRRGADRLGFVISPDEL